MKIICFWFSAVANEKLIAGDRPSASTFQSRPVHTVTNSCYMIAHGDLDTGLEASFLTPKLALA